MSFLQEKTHAEPTIGVHEKSTPSSSHASHDLSGEPRSLDPKAESRLLLKCDLNIMPILFVLYMFSFLDRINIGNVCVMMAQETVSWCFSLTTSTGEDPRADEGPSHDDDRLQSCVVDLLRPVHIAGGPSKHHPQEHQAFDMDQFPRLLLGNCNPLPRCRQDQRPAHRLPCSHGHLRSWNASGYVYQMRSFHQSRSKLTSPTRLHLPHQHVLQASRVPEEDDRLLRIHFPGWCFWWSACLCLCQVEWKRWSRRMAMVSQTEEQEHFQNKHDRLTCNSPL